MRTNFFCAGHPLIDGDWQLDAELRGDRLGFGHYFADHRRCLRMAHERLERRAGQRADRVEGDVAEELHPDLVAKPGGHRRTQAGADEDCRERLDAIGPRAARLAEAQTIAFGVMNDARLGDVGGEVRQRADHTLGLNRLRNRAARIDALEVQTVQLAGVVLEIPPRNAVLRADDDRVGAEQRPQLGRKSRQAVRFDAEDDDVRAPDRREIARRLRLHLEITLVAHDPQAALLHGAQVRSAREQHHVGARFRELRADVAADGAGAGDRDSHDAFRE